MLKIENRGCHGNGSEKLKKYAFLFISQQKLKVGKISRKSIFSISKPKWRLSDTLR